MRRFITICFVSVFATVCGGGHGTNTFSVTSRSSYNKFDEVVRFGAVVPVKETAGRYRIYFDQPEYPSAAAGHTLEMVVVIEDDRGLIPGSFALTKTDSRRVLIELRTRKGVIHLDGAGDGEIQINEVENHRVSGRVEVDDGKVKIEGMFLATPH